MIDTLLKNPWLRSFIPLLLLGVSGVSTSSLVVEISVGNEIMWKDVPFKFSFYLLTISSVLLCSYQVAISRHDNKILKGITPKQYEANLRNEVAEETAKRARKLIKDGKIDQLEKETETFKKLFGEGVK